MSSERRMGVASREEIAGLTGLEMLAGDDRRRAARRRRSGRPWASGSSRWRTGRAVFEGAAGPHLLNPLGGVHGGVALTLIDSAAGCAVHTELPAGIGYTTVETKVNFTRPVPPDGTPSAARAGW